MPRCIVWRFVNRKVDYGDYIFIMQDVPFKLLTDDVARIEATSGKRVQDFAGLELSEVLTRLGIENLKLTPREELTVADSCPSR